MPRKVNQKCVKCAQLSADKARQLHGPDGDSCWDNSVCRRRRSHYRKRQKINEDRRIAYRQRASDGASLQAPVETVSLTIAEDTKPYATLYIWREKRKDAPVHAIAASVFKDGSKVLEVAPVHCAGFRRRELEDYVQKKMMPYLKARYGIKVFADQVRMEPIECPIEGCPLHADKAASLEQIDLLEGASDG